MSLKDCENNMKNDDDVRNFCSKIKDLLSKYDEVYNSTNNDDLYLDDSLRLKHFYELYDYVVNNWDFINSNMKTFQKFIKTCVVKITNCIKILRIGFQLINIASNIYMKYNETFELDYYECFICTNVNCFIYNKDTNSFNSECHNTKENYYLNFNNDGNYDGNYDDNYDDNDDYDDYDDYDYDDYDYDNNDLDT
jgi:hypothetical protein